MTTKTIEEIFAERTCYHFSDKAVPLSVLQEIYDTIKLGPTFGNCCPLRIVFVQSASENEKLKACVAEGSNAMQVDAAPVTALFAHDTKFYKKMDRLFPVSPGLAKMLEENKDMAEATMKRNSALQGGYFMMVARAKGLGCGPKSGFNEEAINKAFFAGTDHKINFICTLGYRSQDEEHPRMERLTFDEVCKIV